ncbi:MAG TPA: hypothetical protein VFF93_10460 [Luteimonas sp.]|nr:hypothetical protein [Luteimonas sp.]
MAVQVSLDPTATPPVTVQPPIHSVNHGNHTVTWEPASNQQFTFKSLSFANNPSCFGTPSILDAKVTVTDDNPANGTETDYPYTIVVTSNGQDYSSGGAGPGADPGSSIIKNK